MGRRPPEVFSGLVCEPVVMAILVWFGVCRGSPAQDPAHGPAQNPFGAETLPNGVVEKVDASTFP